MSTTRIQPDVWAIKASDLPGGADPWGGLYLSEQDALDDARIMHGANGGGDWRPVALVEITRAPDCAALAAELWAMAQALPPGHGPGQAGHMMAERLRQAWRGGK